MENFTTVLSFFVKLCILLNRIQVVLQIFLALRFFVTILPNLKLLKWPILVYKIFFTWQPSGAGVKGLKRIEIVGNVESS